MRIKPILFSLLLFNILSAFAQNEPCGTMQYLQQALQNDPDLAMKMQQIELNVQQRIANMENNPSSEQLSVITIPVVFHVIYHGSNQNVSNAQLLSQLDVLNEDYRRLNADTIYTPSQFKPVATDPHIEFCLAQRDPNNMPTSGITRTYTATLEFNTNDDVKFNNSGGYDAWPATDYLNIWVCKLNGIVLGYAQFPGMSQSTDGVVLDYRTVGRTPDNPFGGANDLGRTGTHEVGHWLNLRHIWGDGPCGVDDGVNDTPESDAPNYGCSVLHVSCGTNDMVQNYMDYSADDCMNIFTIGQAARMKDALDNLRPSIASSQACDPLTVPPLVDFNSDATTVCMGDTVSYFDLSAYNPTAWHWAFMGGDPAVSISQSPKVVYNTPGIYDVKLVATNQFGSDSLIKSTYITVTGANRMIPHQEGFENVQFPSVDWKIYNPDGDRQWERQSAVSGFGNSSAAVKFDNFSNNSNPTGSIDGLISPLFDFSAMSNPYITFDVAYAKYNATNSDTLLVSYSTDCGNEFFTLWYKGGSDLATAPNQTTAFTPSNTQWRKDSIDISSLAGEPVVAIGFFNLSGWGNNLYIDNILISDEASVTPHAAFSADQTNLCAGESIHFTDLSTNIPGSWSWTFPGANADCTTCQNPNVTYDTPGVYLVKLVVSNSFGTDSLEQINYINVSEQPVVSVSKKHVKCNGGSTGYIHLSMTGGTAPFNYHWSDGGSNQNLNNLIAGTYYVSITDSNGCSITKSIQISQPAAMIANTSTTPTGVQPNGTATVGVIGGKAPYTYLWDDPSKQNTATATGLSAGTYHVSITDADTCHTTATATVSHHTGIGKPKSIIDVEIYPNPADQFVDLEVKSNKTENFEIVLYDELGRQVFHAIERGKMSLKKQIDISELENGIYMIRILTGKNEISRKLLVLH